jgi:hypothetical protein
MIPVRALWIVLAASLLLLTSCKSSDDDSPLSNYTLTQLVNLSNNPNTTDFFVEFNETGFDRGRPIYYYQITQVKDFDYIPLTADLDITFLDANLEAANDFEAEYDLDDGIMRGSGEFYLDDAEQHILQFRIDFSYNDTDGIFYQTAYTSQVEGCRQINDWGYTTDTNVFDSDIMLTWSLQGNNMTQGAWVWSWSSDYTEGDQQTFNIPYASRSYTIPEDCVTNYGYDGGWKIEFFTGNYFYSQRILTVMDARNNCGANLPVRAVSGLFATHHGKATR